MSILYTTRGQTPNFRYKLKYCQTVNTDLPIYQYFVVSSHLVPRSFCTQFGHSVSNLVISYLLLYFNLKLFLSFHTQFLQFRTQVISYLESFRTQFLQFRTLVISLGRPGISIRLAAHCVCRVLVFASS